MLVFVNIAWRSQEGRERPSYVWRVNSVLTFRIVTVFMSIACFTSERSSRRTQT